MKIKYIKLKNFANIYTVFKSKEIEIDFSLSKNKVILITGTNGSGKTSILSCLHPFANNGNLDIRSDNPLILNGKDGYKEIIYTNNNNEYIIKHFYKANKNTHSVKSYITKNNEELNPNGNVTSFKEIVKEELDIEMDYLKLSRLGSNVTNFIDLKATERKSFMGKILNELDIYLKYYKDISNELIKIKTIISHLNDKINKLSIDNIDNLKKYQNELKSLIKTKKQELDNFTNELSIIDYEISKYDNLPIIKEKIDLVLKELKKIYKNLEKNKTDDMTIEKCENILTELNNNIISLESSIKILISNRNILIDQYDKYIIERKAIKDEMEKIKNNSNIIEIENIISSIKKSIDKRNSEYNIVSFNPPCTKTKIEEIIVSFDNCIDILNTTYEFGRNPIKKAIECIARNENINDYINTTKKRMKKNKLQTMSEFVYNELINDYKTIPNPICNNSHECPIMNFYNTLYDLATELPDEIIEDDEFITYTKMANQNILTVINTVKSYNDIIVLLPKDIQDMLSLKNILMKIENLEKFYDRKKLFEILTQISEYELYEKDLEELKENKIKLKLFKSNISNSDFLENRLSVINSEISDINEQINTLTEDISVKSLSLQKLHDDKNKYDELKKSMISLDDVENELNELNESYDKVSNLQKEKINKNNLLNNLNFEYSKINKEYNDNEYRLNSYKELKKEFDKYRNKYDDMLLVKKSLSSKEGIPLLFIQVYLKNIQDITNDLLNIIYNDELYLDNFNITSEEFKLPFFVKGTYINDISYASQGEKSFISLALSFALIYQAISRYNIMLLDEIDSTLDTKNREKFLLILEKQMDMIDSEQLFLISHNNMFSTYPVDIIDTKNKSDSSNKLANYIKIKIR